jgi:hypothetical protein
VTDPPAAIEVPDPFAAVFHPAKEKPVRENPFVDSVAGVPAVID